MDSASVVTVNSSNFLNNGAGWGGAISTVGLGKLEISTPFLIKIQQINLILLATLNSQLMEVVEQFIKSLLTL